MSDHHTQLDSRNQRAEPVMLHTPVPDTPAAASPDIPTDPLIGLIGTFLHHLSNSLLDCLLRDYAQDLPQGEGGRPLAELLRDPAVSPADKLNGVRRAAGAHPAGLPDGLQKLLSLMTSLEQLYRMLALPVPSVRTALHRARPVTQTLIGLAGLLKPSPGRERVVYWLGQLAGAVELALSLSEVGSVPEGIDLAQRLAAQHDAPPWVSPLLSLADTVVARILLRQGVSPEAAEASPAVAEAAPAGKLQAFAAAYRQVKGAAERVQLWLAVLSDAQLLPSLEPYLPEGLRGSSGLLPLFSAEAFSVPQAAGLADYLRPLDRLTSPDFIREVGQQGMAGQALAVPLGQLAGYYNADASRRAVTLLVHLSDRRRNGERLLQARDGRLLLAPEVWRTGAALVSAPAAAADALWRLLSSITDYTPGGVAEALRRDLNSAGSALMGLINAVCTSRIASGLVLAHGLFRAGRAWGRGDWSGMVTGLSAALAGALGAAGGEVAGPLIALVKQLVMAGALYAYRNASVAENEMLVAGLKVLMAASPEDPLLRAQRRYIDWWPVLVLLRQQDAYPQAGAGEEVDPEQGGLPGWLAMVYTALGSGKVRQVTGADRLRQRLEGQLGEWLGEGLTRALMTAGQQTAAGYAGGQSPVAQAVAQALGGTQGWFARLGERLSGAANMALVFNVLAVMGEPGTESGAENGPVALDDDGEGYVFLLPESGEQDAGHSLWFWAGGTGVVMALLGGLLWWLSRRGAGLQRALAAGELRRYDDETGGAAWQRGESEDEEQGAERLMPVVPLAGERRDEGAPLAGGSGPQAVPAMTRAQDAVMRHFGNASLPAQLLTGTGVLMAVLSGIGKWQSVRSAPQAQRVSGSASYEATLRSLEREGGDAQRRAWLTAHGYYEANIAQVEADFAVWQRLRAGLEVDGTVLAGLVRRLHSRARLAPEGEKAVGVLYDARGNTSLGDEQGLKLALKSSTGKVLYEGMFSGRGLSAGGEWHLSVARQINAEMAQPHLQHLGVSVRQINGAAEGSTFQAGPGATATDNVILAAAGSQVVRADWSLNPLTEQYAERVVMPAGTSAQMREFTEQQVLSDMVMAQHGTPEALTYNAVSGVRRARLLARKAWYEGEAAARVPGENGGWVYGQASREAYTARAAEMGRAANRLIVRDTAQADWEAGLNGAGYQPGSEESRYQHQRISELLLDSPLGLTWRDADVLLVKYTAAGGQVRYVPFRLSDVMNQRHREAPHLQAGETAAVMWWRSLQKEDADLAAAQKKIPALAEMREEWRLQQQIKGESARLRREKTALGRLNPDLGRFTFTRWSEDRIKAILRGEGVSGMTGDDEVLLNVELTWQESGPDGYQIDVPPLVVQEQVSLREIAWGYLRRLVLQAGKQKKYTDMGRPGSGRGRGEGAGKTKAAAVSAETRFAGNGEKVARAANQIAEADFYSEYASWLNIYRARGGDVGGLSHNVSGVVRTRLAAMPGVGAYRNVSLGRDRSFLTGVVQREFADGRVVILSLLDNRQWLFADRAAVTAA